MAILGFGYDKLAVEKNEEIIGKGGDFKITYNVSLKNMKDFDLKTPDKQDALRFNFEFAVKYDPEIGTLSMAGNIVYSETPDKIKIIKEHWKKNKDVPDDIKAELINVVFRRSNIKALALAQEVNLPPHISMPKLIPPDKDPKNYIG